MNQTQNASKDANTARNCFTITAYGYEIDIIAMISYDYEDSGYDDDDVTAISTKLLLILMFVKR